MQMAAGDKVTLWYGSANRDESKFADPWTFDVRRHPNPHVGFGGGGAHFCLGANLARREITVAFEELHRQIPDLSATEEPDRLQSAFIHGIKRLPVSWTPRALSSSQVGPCRNRPERRRQPAANNARARGSTACEARRQCVHRGVGADDVPQRRVRLGGRDDEVRRQPAVQVDVPSCPSAQRSASTSRWSSNHGRM